MASQPGMRTNFARAILSLLFCMAMPVLGGCGGGSPASAGGSTSGGGTTYYTVGGTVVGLGSDESVTLQNGGGSPLTLGSNGPFTFSDVASGSPYDVTVQSTSGTNCSVVNGSGTVGALNVTGIGVSCNVRTETILYSFSGVTTPSGGQGSDGIDPQAGPIMDSAGNLYGTTVTGGSHDIGTVFKVGANGTETVLYSFTGSPDGNNPYGGLVMDNAGNLYGTTEGGGVTGEGTVFEVSASGTETILHSFTGNISDGAGPLAGLVMDSAGNLYGTTVAGGEYGHGTVFKISAAGTESVLYSLGSGTDGSNPQTGLIMDGAGNLYGTTPNGGASGHGTVFKLSPLGIETILHSFGAGADGQQPSAAVTMDGAGNLYGTTNVGGANDFGTVFEISAAGAETVLYSFTGVEGAGPRGVIVDGDGNLYGTTGAGGSYNEGTVFELSAAGTETILYSFGSETAGQNTNAGNPNAGLMMDGAGNLYGTTPYGGGQYHDGTVFRID